MSGALYERYKDALRRVLGRLDPHPGADEGRPDGQRDPVAVADGTPDPMPQPASAPPSPPTFDPQEAMVRLDAAADLGDPTAIRDLALAAATGHRAADQPDAAIEACYLALGSTPADADLHLALAELYLDRGWRTLAVDKLVLLTRLADLADDPLTRGRLCDVARTRLADEPRLTALCE
ncbi:MAG: hypothetical protein H0U37_11005 [Chloroflexi bacterium]|nr:hypothetical protein [Chloroflexota bacterium]